MDESQSHRLFLGVSVPKAHLAAFAQFRASMPPQAGVRWVPESNLHLTTYFFGKVYTEQLSNLQSLLQLALEKERSFSLQFQRFQLAPKPQSPRMIWARYQHSESFTQLVQAVHRLYQQIDPDLQIRNRPKPHVTLARLKAVETDQLNLVATGPTVPWEIKELVLWESILRPGGAVYQELRRYRLP